MTSGRSATLNTLLEGAAAPRLGPDGQLENPLVVVELDQQDDRDWLQLAPPLREALRAPHVPVVGVTARPLPDEATSVLEALTFTLAPSGPGRTWVDADPRPTLDALRTGVASAPQAAFTLASVLEATAGQHVARAVVTESLAYSMLLAGPEFARWRSQTLRRQVPRSTLPAVVVERHGDRLDVVLNRPERHNAFGVDVRDAFLAVLDIATLDPSVCEIRVTGAGASFCSGGDLDEFGTATDVAAAHLVRLATSAGLAAHRLADRLRPVLHGAWVGAGVEITALADHVVAREGAWFQLPELAMGLIPGAGGTVSLPRRIGRWRTAYLALTGCRLDLTTALRWGLVDERA